MIQNYKSTDSKDSKKLSEQKITKRSSPPLHFLSKFLYLCSFIFIFIACDTAVSSPSPDLSSWTQLRANSHFSARHGHSSVVLKNSAGIDEIYIIGGITTLNPLDNVWKSADKGLTWTEIETTTKFPARNNHSSVVLKNSAGIDEIYVIGGYDGNIYFNDVWKSADKGLTWTEVKTTTTFPARSDHSSVVIGSDIYVIGGFDGSSVYLDDVWKSADKGLTWTEVASTTIFPARSRHSSVVIGSDIYVIGGFDGTNGLNDVWKSANGGLAWTEVTTTGTSTKFSARSRHSSVVLKNSAGVDEIYVIGGYDGTKDLDDVWKSADKGLTWTQVAMTKFPARNNHSSVILGNEIYVIGGVTGFSNQFNDVWKSTNGVEWISRVKPNTTLFSARNSHSSVVIDSDIYVIGGNDGTTLLNDVWKSSDAITWTQVAATTIFPARDSHSSVVIGSDIYVIDGGDNTKLLNDVWKSTDKGLTWTQVTTTGTKFPARAKHSSVVIGSDIYVIGGNTGGNEYLNDVWKSADEGLTWTEVATTETKFSKRQGHSSVVIGSDIYVIGGYAGSSAYLDDVWKSADEGLTWTQVTTTGTKFPARSRHSSVVVGSDIYIIGGYNPENFDDIWKSADKGLTWTQVIATGAKFPARSEHSSVVRGSAVYVIGGFSSSGQLNDVWVSR